MKTRVLFISPEMMDWGNDRVFYVPHNYLYLSGLITKDGYHNSLLDLNVVKHSGLDVDTEILKRIEDEQPTLVGIGCLFSGQLDALLHYSDLIKAKYPHIKIVTGGIHPTMFYKEMIENCPSLDYIVVGEGELPLLRLVNYLEGKGSLENIVRLAYRDSSGNLQYKDGADYFADLDMLPFPNYNLVDIKDYHQDTSEWHNPRKLPINTSLPLLASRACPLRCNFCSMYLVMGKKWRHRSYKNVVDEIEWLYREQGYCHFSIMDDNFTVSKEHIIGMCNEIIKRGLNIQIETPNGISTKFMDEEVMAALVSAGLIRVSLAIESGSDYIRNIVMGKKVTSEQLYNVIALTKKYEKELYVRTFFIMGMPEETHQTLQDTYDMIIQTDVDKPIVSNLAPFPGTRVFAQAVRDNLLIDELDVESVWKTGKFFFTGQKKFFLKPYSMTIEELSEWRTKLDILLDSEIKRKSEWRKTL